MSNPPARLLLDHLHLFADLDSSVPILDLACGTGRNGLALTGLGLSLVFADRSDAALETVEQRLADFDGSARLWTVDLEQPGVNPLADSRFSAIICFRYLYRPLFPAIRESLVSGGLLLYETFIVDQARFGRPKNPDFLLQAGELKTEFLDWQQIHYFEGVLPGPDRAVAQIVARKP